jgi:hypothetical protein
MVNLIFNLERKAKFGGGDKYHCKDYNFSVYFPQSLTRSGEECFETLEMNLLEINSVVVDNLPHYTEYTEYIQNTQNTEKIENQKASEPKKFAKFIKDNKCFNSRSGECNVESFSIVNRRHHCRKCGKSFCYKCCSQFVKLIGYESQESTRVCDKCN